MSLDEIALWDHRAEEDRQKAISPESLTAAPEVLHTGRREAAKTRMRHIIANSMNLTERFDAATALAALEAMDAFDCAQVALNRCTCMCGHVHKAKAALAALDAAEKERSKP